MRCISVNSINWKEIIRCRDWTFSKLKHSCYPRRVQHVWQNDQTCAAAPLPPHLQSIFYPILLRNVFSRLRWGRTRSNRNKIESLHSLSPPCPLPVHAKRVICRSNITCPFEGHLGSGPDVRADFESGEISWNASFFYGRRPRTEHVGESRVLCLSWEKDIKEHRGS